MSYAQLSRDLHNLVETGNAQGLAAVTCQYNDLQRSELQIAYRASRGTDLSMDINKSLKNRSHADILSSLWKGRISNAVETLHSLIKKKKRCPRLIFALLFGSSQAEWDEISRTWAGIYKTDLMEDIKQMVHPSDFISALMDKWHKCIRSSKGQLRESAYALKHALHGEEQQATPDVFEIADVEKLSTLLAATSSTEWSTIITIYEKFSGIVFDDICLSSAKRQKGGYDTQLFHMASQFACDIASGVAYTLHWIFMDKDVSDFCALTAVFLDKAPQTNDRYKKYGSLQDEIVTMFTDKGAPPIVELWVPS